MLPKWKMEKAPRTLPLNGTTKWADCSAEKKGQPLGRPVYEWNESFLQCLSRFSLAISLVLPRFTG